MREEEERQGEGGGSEENGKKIPFLTRKDVRSVLINISGNVRYCWYFMTLCLRKGQ